MAYNNERLVSEFNGAVYQIMRMHEIWNSVRHFREQGNLQAVNWKLDSAFVELSADAIRLDKSIKTPEKKYMNRMNAVNEKIEEYVLKKESCKLYKALLEKEIILRELQEEAGKGAKLSNPDDDWGL